jgi:hypothetical protein
MVNKINIEYLALFDHRRSLLLIYAAITMLGLGLALTLEFGIGLSPATVLRLISRPQCSCYSAFLI